MSKQPFSTGWVIASIVIFTALELLIGLVLAPAIFAGRMVASQMWRIRVEMLMHLGSFFLGGILVGLLSPGVRLLEPAVGAFVSVLLVFLWAVFMPYSWFHFDLSKIVVGGGIAFGLGLAGAYSGEKWMGNIPDDGARARLRSRMWGDRGMLGRSDARALDDKLAELQRRS